MKLLQLAASDRGAVADLSTEVSSSSRDNLDSLECGVPDTPDGRYDMMVAHVVLVLRRRAHSKTKNLAQALFDLMFADMDQNLRNGGGRPPRR